MFYRHLRILLIMDQQKLETLYDFADRIQAGKFIKRRPGGFEDIGFKKNSCRRGAIDRFQIGVDDFVADGGCRDINQLLYRQAMHGSIQNSPSAERMRYDTLRHTRSFIDPLQRRLKFLYIRRPSL